MSCTRWNYATLLAAVVLFALSPGARAAKGVKKNNAAGNQTFTGVISNVNNQTGTFVLASTRTQKSVVNLNGVQVPLANRQSIFTTFHVTPKTAVIQQNGAPIGLGGIRPGAQAKVISAGNQEANVVQTYLPRPSTTPYHRYGYVTRYRTHRYHPHYYRPHLYRAPVYRAPAYRAPVYRPPIHHAPAARGHAHHSKR